MQLITLLFGREHWFEIASIVVVGVCSILFYADLLSLPLLLAGMLFALYPLGSTAVKALLQERKIGTELFITIAVIISIVGKEYLAGAIVLMIILIAEYIASVAEEKARSSIRDLIGHTPQTALVKKDGHEYLVTISEIKIGEIVLARAGDRIPVDGTVIGGSASVNQASITGESMPEVKIVGAKVYAGTFVETGALDIRVSALAEDTVFAKIIALVEEAQSTPGSIQQFTDRVAGWLIPIVFIFIGCVYFYTQDIKLIIALLIFTSPAELGLATPLVTIAAIARAAREGILVKGGLYLEGLARADTFVFDKTGTLTVGRPIVRHIEIVDKEMTESDFVLFAGSANKRSGHPLAQAVLAYAKEKKVRLQEPTQFEDVKGRGVKALVKGHAVVLGNRQFMEEESITIIDTTAHIAETVLFLAVDNKMVGVFHVNDAIRPEAKQMVKSLRQSGVKNVVLLSGDNEETAQYVGFELGIEDVRANLLPEDKIRMVKEMQKSGAFVVMVGDGVNDTPALAQATVGIAMGAIGTESAMEAADIVLMNDDLTKISLARAISRRAYRTIQENIYVGVGVVHVTGITLVLLHIIGPIEAAAIHLVPDFLVFLNSIKLLRVRIDT